MAACTGKCSAVCFHRCSSMRPAALRQALPPMLLLPPASSFVFRSHCCSCCHRCLLPLLLLPLLLLPVLLPYPCVPWCLISLLLLLLPIGSCLASREMVEIELRRRKEAAANLERLRKRHEADKESARRTYMESKR